MAVNNFDVLKRMAMESDGLQLCDTVTEMNYSAKKGGTEVTVGVPGNVCFQIDSGELVAKLLLFNVAAFNKMKAKMEAEGQP
jgi:hypothetical protein